MKVCLGCDLLMADGHFKVRSDISDVVCMYCNKKPHRPSQYEEKLLQQGGICSICKDPPTVIRRLAQDHDHSTGQLRDLLCSKCNCAIGLLKDDPTVVEPAFQYLLRHKGSLN